MTRGQQLFLTEKALRLHEYPSFAGEPERQAKQAGDALERWKENTFRNQQDAFDKRLRMQGFDPAEAQGLFCLPVIKEPADWVKELGEILNLLPSSPEAILSRLMYNPILEDTDFYAFLSPVLLYMEHKLTTVFRRDILSEKARMDIMANGYSLIKFIFKRFSIHALNKRTGDILPQPIENLREHYEAFAEDMLNDGFERAFLEYPCLGRQLIERIGLWLRFMEELTGHLMMDRPRGGMITGLSLSTGDTHHYGRSVAIVEYDEVVKIVYKPQNGEIYDRYGEFLSFLAELGAIETMKCAKVLLSRPDHCYIEFIEHSAITDKDKGAKRYYHRIGQMLGLFYAIGTEDMHNENIIACGEYPVMVDLETLLTAKTDRFVSDTVKDETCFYHTVTKTIMLVIGDASFGGVALMQSGKSNVPFCADGTALDFAKAGESILSGFQFAYRNIARNREAIYLKLTALFQNCRFRSVLRSTQTYFEMLDHIGHIAHLSDGLAQSFETERFFSAYSICEDEAFLQTLYPVFAEERDAVLRGDIPFFSIEPDRLGISFGGRELCCEFFEQSAFDNTKRILQSMSHEDYAAQCKMLEMAVQSVVKKDFPAFIKPLKETPLLSDCQFIDEAIKIYDKIMGQRITVEGKPCFLTLHTATGGNLKGKSYLRVANNGLYSGTVGYALFFGALYAVTRQEKYKDSAIELMGAAYHRFSYVLRQTQVGAAEGVGGLALALYYMADYLHDRSYAEMARTIIAKPINLPDVEEIDYLAGLSGYISTAHTVGADKTLVEQAADRLVSLQVPYGGFKVWKSGISQKPLTGMGHGLSGVAAALIKAYGWLGKAEYLRCVEDALAYEARFYDETNGWPDLRDGHSEFMHGFCSGAPGIGMSRLEMLSVSEELDGRLTEDIERAVRHIYKRIPPMLPNDDFCCGNTAAADFLITLSQERGDKSFLLEARRRLSWMVDRKNTVGIFGNGSNANLDTIGFFNGISGIGYSMLRLVSSRIRKVV